MQQRDNVALAEAIVAGGGERNPVHRLEVDFRGDGSWVDLTPIVRRMTVDRSLTGDLPEDAGLIDGYTAAELTAELEGVLEVNGVEWSAVDALSPIVPGNLRDGTRLVKATARAYMGVVTDAGPVLLPMFIGPVRILDGDEGGGVVSLHAVDPSDRLRAPITLPTFAEFITHAVRRPWALTINTQWVVHHVLAENGRHASPPPRDEAIIVASGHGGLAANRGFNGAPISLYGTGPQAGTWTEDSHPYGMLGTPENASGGTVGYIELYGVTDGVTPPFRLASGQGVGLSCLLHMGNYMALGADFENRLFQIRPATVVGNNADNEYPRLFVSGFGNGDIYCGLTTAAGSTYATPRIPTGAGRWRFFGVHFRYTSATTLEVRVRLDGQTRTYTLTVPSLSPTYRPVLQVNAQMFRAWTNLQVWPSYAPPAAGEWQGERHTAQCSIARGLNELTHLPDVVGADSWELLKSAVAAEFGVHSHDETGWYSFRPRTDVRRTEVDVELDVRTNLVDAKWSETTDSVRNVVTLATKAGYHSGKWQTVVKGDDALQFVCPPGTTRFLLDWPYGAAGIRGGLVPYHWTNDSADPTFAKWSGDVVQGFTYSYGSNWTGEQNVNNVVVTFSQVGDRALLLNVSNTTSENRTVRLATDASVANLEGEPGEPALRIGGWPFVEGTEHVEEVRASAAKIADDEGERVLPLEASEWRQRPDAMRPVMQQLLEALAEEVVTLEDLEVVADPRVQVGDVARCRFPGGATPITGTVVATHPSAGDDGLTMTVSVRPLPVASLAPAGWSFYVDISRYQGDVGTPLDLARVKAAGYRGCVVKIGQGANTGAGQALGALIDPWWERFRDAGRALWPRTFAGYWYVGGTEAPADQAARCKAALGDLTIPIMLDWEDGGGSWTNLLNVLAAFRAAGLRVRTLYTNMQGYAPSNGATNIDQATGGLGLVNSRYWISRTTNPAQDPAAVFADIQRTNPSFGFGTVLGGTIDALQFTDAGIVYPGSMQVDVNAFRGDEDALAVLLGGA